MFQHGEAVWSFTQKLIFGTTQDMRLPDWFAKHRDKILSSLHDLTIIRTYNIYHDCGKPRCRVTDSEGRNHYPNHAEISKQTWLEADGDPIISNLIGLDMIMHTEKPEQIIARKLSIQDTMTLLITALAEIHANASMFGGIESTSFKIKYKKLDRTGKALMNHHFKELS